MGEIKKTLELMTINEAHKAMKETLDFSISLHALRKLVNEGRIPHVPIGNRKMISLYDLADYLASEKGNTYEEARR